MGRRLALVKISGELFQEFITCGRIASKAQSVRCIRGLPPGAKFVSWVAIPQYSSLERATTTQDLLDWGAIFEHESFRELHDDEPIPEIRVEYVTDTYQSCEAGHTVRVPAQSPN